MMRAVLRRVTPRDSRSWAAFVHPTYRFGLSSPQRLMLIDLWWVLVGCACIFLGTFTDRFVFLTVWILCLITGWAAGMARSRRAMAYFAGWRDGRGAFADALLREMDDLGPLVTKSGRLLTDMDVWRLAHEAEEHADDDR